MKRLTDDCHEQGAAVMIQLTHLGRRTRWDKGDWLPVVGAGPAREPAHRAFPKMIEDWDIARIIDDYADAAERMKAAGLDGVEFECYGHLMDQFWSPLTNTLAGPLWRLPREPPALRHGRAGSLPQARGAGLPPRRALHRGRGGDRAASPSTKASRSRSRFKASGLVDFLNVIRGHIDTDAALTDVIPIQGMRSRPASRFRRDDPRREVGMPTFHAARIPDVATARHAIASGKLDMVGMTRAHMADPHIVRKIMEGREHDIRPCVGATYCLDRIYQGGMALCIHNPATGREETMPHAIAPAPRSEARRHRRRRPRGARGGARRRRARPSGHRVRGGGRARRADPAHRAHQAPARDDRHHRLAHGAVRRARRRVPLQHLCRGRRRAGGEARRGHHRHRRPAAEGRSRSRQRSHRLRLGHSVGRREARRERAALTTTRATTRRCRPRNSSPRPAPRSRS